MANDKKFSPSEKEDIRLKVLASMILDTNANLSKKTNGSWQFFWKNLLKKKMHH